LRTHTCSTSFANALMISVNRWSSRRRPQRCSRSSAHRRPTWRRSSRPCWRTPHASVPPSSAFFGCAKATHTGSGHCTARRPHSPQRDGANRSSAPGRIVALAVSH
jgi:hypothetical protein